VCVCVCVCVCSHTVEAKTFSSERAFGCMKCECLLLSHRLSAERVSKAIRAELQMMLLYLFEQKNKPEVVILQVTIP